MPRLKLWLPLLIAALLGGVLCACIFVALHNLPAVEALQDYQPKGVTRLIDRNGQLFGEIFHERRMPVRLELIPADLKHAVVAVEDSEFFEHTGISVRGILRAFLKNIWRGRLAEGGSTLTQQLTKVLFLSPDKSLLRKFKEMILAFQIEKNYSKDEILELYLNQIYMGEGNYGAAAAANYYFCKSLDQLSLAENAALASVPKGPSLYAPTRNPELNRKRRLIVLQAMLKHHYIDQSRYDSAAAEELKLNICPSPGMRNHVSAMLLMQLQDQLGENEVHKGRLQVFTTIDKALQESAEASLNAGLTEIERRRPRAAAATLPPLQAALIAIDPRSGEIRALVGGRDFRQSQFNRAIQARRQVGSAFKPFVYALALDNGYNESSLVDDAPQSYRGLKEAQYNPDNYTRTFLGPVTLRRALELSLNSIPLQLTSRLGVEALRRSARDLGITASLPDNLTIALGSGSMTLQELTAAYTPFFALGTLSAPHAIRRVVNDSGETLVHVTVATKQVLQPESAYIMRDMLRGAVLNGTAVALRELDCFAAGKTGTSDDNRDALFVGGLEGQIGGEPATLVAGIWVGYDDNRPLGKAETGASAALPIWKRLAKSSCAQPVVEPTPPAGVVIKRIDHSSGKLATERCPDAVDATFARGTEPTLLCTEEL